MAVPGNTVSQGLPNIMTSQGPIPVPNPTLPYWRTELHELDGHRSTPDLPTECDVLIIGAGYSGASVAHFLYEDNPSPPSVVILEARQTCSGATGRNGKGSQPKCQHGHAASKLEHRWSCQTRCLLQSAQVHPKVRCQGRY